MRRLVLLAAVLAIAGCGEEEREAEAPPPATELTVTVDAGGDPRTRTVTDAMGLTAADLAPTPPTTACTEIYGGDATATITGRLDGEPVEAEFSLENGCEIARWDDASALLGDPPTGGGPGFRRG